jgi:hypothetical protein
MRALAHQIFSVYGRFEWWMFDVFGGFSHDTLNGDMTPIKLDLYRRQPDGVP